MAPCLKFVSNSCRSGIIHNSSLNFSALIDNVEERGNHRTAIGCVTVIAAAHGSMGMHERYAEDCKCAVHGTSVLERPRSPVQALVRYIDRL